MHYCISLFFLSFVLFIILISVNGIKSYLPKNTVLIKKFEVGNGNTYSIISYENTDNQVEVVRYIRNAIICNEQSKTFETNSDKTIINFGNGVDVNIDNICEKMAPIVFESFFQDSHNSITAIYPIFPKEHYETRLKNTQKMANNYNCNGGYTIVYHNYFTCIIETKTSITFDRVCDKGIWYRCKSKKTILRIKYEGDQHFIIFKNNIKVPKHYAYGTMLPFLENLIAKIGADWTSF
jgi:hypothetical protein